MKPQLASLQRYFPFLWLIHVEFLIPGILGPAGMQRRIETKSWKKKINNATQSAQKSRNNTETIRGIRAVELPRHSVFFDCFALRSTGDINQWVFSAALRWSRPIVCVKWAEQLDNLVLSANEQYSQRAMIKRRMDDKSSTHLIHFTFDGVIYGHGTVGPDESAFHFVIKPFWMRYQFVLIVWLVSQNHLRNDL